MVEQTDEQILASVVVAGQTVAEHLERAIASGAVIRHADGQLELAQFTSQPGKPADLDQFLRPTSPRPFLPCAFLNRFMFDHVYGKAAVPFGCQACYKVKVISRTMRQMIAVRSLAESLPYATKSGPEVDNPENPHPYGTYLYLNGLEQARAVYRTLRQMIDEHAQLGTEVRMLIKRGCTNYERKCGPSDQYTFDPALEAVEAVLARRFHKPIEPFDGKTRNAIRMLQIIRIAYRIGDETYKDFTDGKPPVLSGVTYTPDP